MGPTPTYTGAVLDLGDPSGASPGAAGILQDLQDTVMNFIVSNLDPWLFHFLFAYIGFRTIAYAISYFRHRGDTKVMGNVD